MSGRFEGLHVLADDDPRWPHDPVTLARCSCEGGARVIQLRAKHASDARALRWAREIRAITRLHGACFVVNDRFDLALASEADAVHLGQTDLAPQSLPPLIRKRLAVGRSTHDPAQARAALEEDVDYVAYGPVFGTTSKQSEYDARGLAALAEVVTIVAPLPVVAIGGIRESQLPAVVRVGARAAAVISAVAASDDPTATTRELVRVWETA